MKPPRMAHMPEDRCPWCNHPVDRATHVGGPKFARPQSGDTSICIRCGGVGMFGDDARLRKPTDAEMVEISEDPRIQNALMAWEAMHHREPT